MIRTDDAAVTDYGRSFEAIATSLGVKPIGVPFAQFVDVALRDIVQGEAKHRRERADVPQAIAEFLRQRLLVKRRRVKEVLLDHLRHFTGLPSQAQCRIRELLFMRAIAPERTRSELLVFVELHSGTRVSERKPVRTGR